MERSLVFVSGYYGFDNLGDEAILEELCCELKELVKPEQIMVLSANPELTAERYGVRSMQRKSLLELWIALSQARLFVSGGGGLFQNTKTLGSIMYYGLQMLMAKAHKAKVVVYAQGIGPLRGPIAESLCRQFFTQADILTVRDDASMRFLQSWNLPALRSADPVWRLEPSQLPASVQQQLNNAGASNEKSTCVGLSLRPSPELTDEHLRNLAVGLNETMAKTDKLLLLPLQAEQDLPVLESFQKIWTELGRSSHMLDTSELKLPSQWVGLFAQLKLLVGMRLHAIIMTLKSGRPVAGIAYDPKVTQLLTEFGQCCLILTKESQGKEWPEALKSLMSGLASYSSLARTKSFEAKDLSCKNFDILAKILNMPSEKPN